jgi:hypothetical protein
MWKIFDVIPGIVWAAALAVALFVAGVSYVRMNTAKQEFATYKAEVAENTRKAEAEVRAKEQAMQSQTERIANDAAKKQTVLAARAATTQLIAGQLRDEVERLNARPAPADPESAAIAREAATARKLLGACAIEYRSVAQGADELRDQVVGLQDYANNVCKNKD